MLSFNIKPLWSTVLEYIFPQFCVACKREGSILCEQCQSTLEVPGVFCCPVCHIPTVGGVCCSECVPHARIVRHSAILPLSEKSLIHELIHLYKYQYIESLEEVFLSLIQRFFRTYELPPIDYLVCVPLHPKRYVERGFNQSERIAKIVSRVTTIPVLPALKRMVNTVKQATLDRKGRLENVHEAFSLVPRYQDLIKGKSILVVDDVYTTGSTIFECASALMNAGAKEVSGWSIARG